jgi:hypothetical protein
MPETLVMKAAAELTNALKGTVLQDAEMSDALAKVSDLFQKIAASKAERAKAKEQRNQHRITRVPVEWYQFQGWKTNHLPDTPCPFQGCRPLQQRMIVA